MNGRLTCGVLLTITALTALISVEGTARADAAFRKKRPPASTPSAGEVAPTGGATEQSGAEAGGAAAGGAAATEAAEPAKPDVVVPQADDPDRPFDRSLLSKKAPEAGVTERGRPRDEGPPFFRKWQFWAITGAIVVGAVAAVWAGSKLYHEANGGDVRPCSTTYLTCFGEGR